MTGKRMQILLAVAGVVVFYVLVKAAAFAGLLNPYWQRVLDQSLIVTIGAMGLSIIYGFTGLFSIGHAAFVGLGAYCAGLISKTWWEGEVWSFLIAIVAGAFFAGLLSYLIGMPVLRLRSDYLGIATLGFGIIVKVALDNANKLIPDLGGATGMTGVPQAANFDWIFVFVLLAIVLCRNFVHSTYGRACTSIREDEVAAEAAGVNTTKYRLVAFVFGCTLAGLAGGLYAHRYPFLHPTNFDFLASIDYLIIVVLGGLGSLTGTLVTAIGWVFLLEGLRFVLGEQFLDFRGVIYALILIITILVRRQGIFGGKEFGPFAPGRMEGGVVGAAAGNHKSLR